jgi:dihydroorotate dehydrogenase
MGFPYRALLRPVLFRLDPERAHEAVAAAGRAVLRLPGGGALLEHLFAYAGAGLRQRLWDLEFSNPVGMAAGFDKTGDLYPLLTRMGFGFVESGTFTAQAQAGNPRPRIVRLPRARALVNRMGFNNPGAERAAATIASQVRTVPRGISVGKSRAAGMAEAAADQRLAVRHLAPLADYLALNVSSPNTPGLRSLQAVEALRDLVGELRQELEELPGRRPPLLVKLAPDLDDAEFDALLAFALEAPLDGLILCNTTLRKQGVPGAEREEGGLSGAPLRARSTELVRRAYRATRGRLPLIGVGGIFSGADALEKIRAGASLVQVYTGYVFAGPGLPRRINRHLDRVCRSEGVSLRDLVGSEAAA